MNHPGCKMVDILEKKKWRVEGGWKNTSIFCRFRYFGFYRWVLVQLLAQVKSWLKLHVKVKTVFILRYPLPKDFCQLSQKLH